MSDTFSARLLREMNNSLSSTDETEYGDIDLIDDIIEVLFEFYEGRRGGKKSLNLYGQKRRRMSIIIIFSTKKLAN